MDPSRITMRVACGWLNPYDRFTQRGVALPRGGRQYGIRPRPSRHQAHRFAASETSVRKGAEMSRARLRRYFRHGLFPQLIVFEAVARLGSVTRAAEELHLAQPTVSSQLKKLSMTLELTLVQPEGRGIRLTAAGEALRAECTALVETFARIDERLQCFRRKETELLRLAAEPEARSVAARLVADFCARHPGVQASVHIAERAQLVQRLAANEDDVYIFDLEVDGLPGARRWSVAHAKGRERARTAALFIREALQSGAYESGPARANGASQGGAILG